MKKILVIYNHLLNWKATTLVLNQNLLQHIKIWTQNVLIPFFLLKKKSACYTKRINFDLEFSEKIIRKQSFATKL